MAKKKKSRADEIAELENAYRSMTGPEKQKRRHSGAGNVLVVLALLVAMGFMAFCFLGDKLFQEPQRLGSVTIAGVDLTGMTRQEAIKALDQATCDTYTEMDMVILVSDTQIHLSPADTGAKLDVEAAVDAALAGQAVDTLNYLSLDRTVIAAALAQLDTKYNADAIVSSCQVKGDMPSLETGSADPCQILVITMGTTQYGLDMDALENAVWDGYRNNRFRVRQDCTQVEPSMPDLQAVYDQYACAPQDAAFDENFQVIPEKYGYDFDLEAARALADGLAQGESAEIHFRKLAPEILAENLNALLYRDTLAAYSTEHTWDENRNTNLRLACEAIDGMVILPGEQFSYNTALGERTSAKGYKAAGAYVNGQTVSTVGGGICQVSSTLYYCTLIADLQIDRRVAHSYVSSYMPMGMDATVSWGGPEFKFTNNTNYPIRLQASVSDGYVHVSIQGTDEKSYYVVMEYELLDTIPYETVYKELPPDNEQGLQNGDIITTPYTGYKVETYKCKYDKQTDELISRKFEASSNYKTRDKVIAKIVDPNETTPPEVNE